MVRNSGVLMLMTVMVAKEIRVVCIHADNTMGITMSIMSMSLEKRLVILPSGVESKKASFERRIFASMPWCRFPAARTRPLARVNEARSTQAPVSK